MAEGAVVAAKKTIGRSFPTKKNTGKVVKKIHKAEREKLKRDHLNDLFLELGLALEPIRQNNGKACILGDAARLLRDLAAHVESLRKENAALIAESRYVTVEKNELKDEKAILETEISRLRNELQERVGSIETLSMLHQPISTLSPMPLPPVRPLYVVPVHQDPRPCAEVGSAAVPPTPTLVRKPQARYPTPSDSWPLELLSRTSQEARHSGSSSSNMSNCSEEGSDKA
nr:transcription factor BHLH062-like protein [Lilium hybrid division I]